MRVTHTYVVLEISATAYKEIRDKLETAGYADQFHKEGDAELIDMHGIAVQAGSPLLAEHATAARGKF
jgi:hypothetical protein